MLSESPLIRLPVLTENEGAVAVTPPTEPHFCELSERPMKDMAPLLLLLLLVLQAGQVLLPALRHPAAHHTSDTKPNTTQITSWIIVWTLISERL